MGVSLKTAKRRSHIAMLCFGQQVRRAKVVRGIAARLCYCRASKVLRLILAK
ncbi:MAG: hypothetical protein JW836_03965 [Deltaproteobacteria bacterium]|nr:hypothetical protein [Deltaproteobacteria bacterium]